MIFHLCMRIDKAISMLKTKKYKDMFYPTSNNDAIKELIKKKNEGKIFFTGCDNETPEGKCGGHEDKEE